MLKFRVLAEEIGINFRGCLFRRALPCRCARTFWRSYTMTYTLLQRVQFYRPHLTSTQLTGADCVTVSLFQYAVRFTIYEHGEGEWLAAAAEGINCELRWALA